MKTTTARAMTDYVICGNCHHHVAVDLGDSMDSMKLSLPRPALVVLFDRMREDLGRRCTCAAWCSLNEQEMPRLCAAAVRQGVPQSWGQHEVSVPEAQALVALAGALGGWSAAFAECR